MSGSGGASDRQSQRDESGADGTGQQRTGRHSESRAAGGGSDRPRLDSKAPIYLLGIGLVLALVLANVAFAADRTALDSDHAVKTMDEAGVYGDITADVQDSVAEDVNQAGGDRISRSEAEQIANDAVTYEYIRGETVRNIENLYAYIDGDDDVRLAIDLTEPKTAMIQEARQRPFGNELAQRIDEEVPNERNITEGGEPPNQLDGAQDVSGAIGTGKFIFALLSLAMVGGIYYFSRQSLRHTGQYAGTAFAVAGVFGLLIGYGVGSVATGAVESALDVDSAEVEALADGLVKVVESTFSTIVTQSWILTVVGVGAVGLVYAEENGYLDSIRDSLGGSEQPRGQQGQQGQYQQGQQGQYQQGQQGQYQQGQQGQYQQGQQGQYQQGGQPNQQHDQYQQGQQGQPQGGQPRDESAGQPAGADSQSQSEGQPQDEDAQQNTQSDDESDGQRADRDPQQYDQSGADSEEN